MACAEVGGVFCVLFVRADRVEVVELVCLIVGPLDAVIDRLFAYPTWCLSLNTVLFEFFAELVESAGVATV